MIEKSDESQRKNIIQHILDQTSFASEEVEIPAIITVRKNGQIEFINAAASLFLKEHLTNLFEGAIIFEIIPTHQLNEFGNVLKSGFSGLGPNFFSISATGGKSVQFNFIPVFDTEGKIDKLQLVLRLSESEIPLNGFSKVAEKQLIQERNLLKAIIDNIPDYIFVKDLNHQSVLSNKKFYTEVIGVSSEESALGLTPLDYFEKEKGKFLSEDNERVMKTGIPVINREDIIYTKNGKKEIVLLTKVPLLDFDKNITGLVGIARNITETYNFRQEQELINKLNKVLGKSSNLKSALTQTIGLIAEFFNFEAAEAWSVGYDKTSLRKIAELKSGILDLFQDTHERHFKIGEGLPGITWQSESVEIWEDFLEDVRFIRKPAVENSSLDFGVGVPIIFKNEVIAVLTFFGKKPARPEFNISEVLERVAYQLSTDIKRKIIELHLNNTIEYSPNLIAVIGLDGYLKSVNPAFNKIFGYPEEELLHTPFKEFLHPEEVLFTMERLKEVAEGRIPKSIQNRCLAKDGQWKWISWTPSCFMQEEGIVHLYGMDITPMKNANLELLKYKNIIESSKDGIGLITIDTEEVYLNAAFKNELGFSENEINGIGSVKELYVDQDLATDLFQTLLSGNYWDGDVQLKGKTGILMDYHLRSGPIFNDTGELIAVFGLHTNINERKAHETAMLDYSNRINNILESITDGFFSLTKNWEVIYWNKEAENLLKVSKETILNKNLWDYFPEAERLLFFTKYKEALDTGKKVSFEEYFEPLDTWFEVNAYPRRGGLAIYFKDISGRKRLDEEIRVANERFELVSKATHEAIYDWDVKNDKMEWSAAYYSTFEYNKALSGEQTLRDWELNLFPEDKNRVIESFKQALQSISISEWSCEYRLVKPSSEIAVVLDRGLIVRDEGGEPLRVIGSMQDITQLKQNEKALEELNEKLLVNVNELAVSNAELEQFAYIASHDLQEPLRMVTSFLTQLQKKYENKLDDKAQQYIHFATDGAVRMRQIIMDLLDYSRIGKLNYQFEEIDLNELVREINCLHGNLINETRATIKFDNLPVISAARIPLQRLLSNLISNGIKYRKSDILPMIEVQVKEGPSKWEFSVSDNGIGISDQFYEKIFVIFQRLHSREQYPGTGIGLAISKKIVENHGGKIWLTSQLGKGSAFHFTIKRQF